VTIKLKASAEIQVLQFDTPMNMNTAYVLPNSLPAFVTNVTSNLTSLVVESFTCSFSDGNAGMFSPSQGEWFVPLLNSSVVQTFPGPSVDVDFEIVFPPSVFLDFVPGTSKELELEAGHSVISILHHDEKEHGMAGVYFRFNDEMTGLNVTRLSDSEQSVVFIQQTRHRNGLFNYITPFWPSRFKITVTMTIAQPAYPGSVYQGSIPSTGGVVGFALQNLDKRKDGVSLRYMLNGLSIDATVCLNAGMIDSMSFTNGVCGFDSTNVNQRKYNLVQQTANGNETW